MSVKLALIISSSIGAGFPGRPTMNASITRLMEWIVHIGTAAIGQVGRSWPARLLMKGRGGEENPFGYTYTAVTTVIG